MQSGSIDTAAVVDGELAALYQHVLAIASTTIDFAGGDYLIGSDGPTQDLFYNLPGHAGYTLVVDGTARGIGHYNMGYVAASPDSLESAVTVSFQGGKVFTPTALKLSSGGVAYSNQTVTVTGFKADNSFVASATHTIPFNSASFGTLNLTNFTDVTRLVITTTDNGGKLEYFQLTDLVLTNVQAPDTTPPAAPGQPDLDAASDSGSSATDNVTNDATPLVKGVGAEAGSTVRLYDTNGTTLVGSTLADAGGAWSITSSALSNGAHTLTAQAVDAAGNASAASTGLSIVVDTVAPTATIASAALSADTGHSATDFITGTAAQTVSGTLGANLAAGEIVQVSLDNGGSWNMASASVGSNTWAYAATLVSSGTLQVGVTDAAGNVGAAHAQAYVLDTSAPALAITSNKSTLKSGETATVTFTFSEDPGVSFTTGDVSITGGALGALSGSGLTRSATFTPTADTNGGSAGITVAAGLYTDTAGNAGGAGTTLSISFDTLAPTLAITSSASNLKAGDTAAITFTFSEDPGASFSTGDISVTGGTLSAISGSGLTRSATFTPNPNTDNGTATITVGAGTYADAAVNPGGAGAAPSLTFDTLAPNAPALPDLAAASDSGSASSDNLTSGTALDLRGAAGSAEACATIRLYDGATLVATTSATGSGSWQADGISLAEGVHLITGTATDAAGNTSAASSGLALTIDRTPPAAPIAPDLLAASDSGASAGDDITNEDTPTFTGAAGSAAPGATVRLYGSDGSTVIASTTAAGVGSWSASSGTLAEGTHTITARATDAAGNESAASGTLALTVDRSAPATTGATIAFSSDTGISATDMLTAEATQTTSGTLNANLAAGEQVEVSLDNGASWRTASATAGADTWSLAATLAASNTLQVRVTDAAGNAGTAFTRAYVLDAAAPAAPSTPDLAAASDSGGSSSDDITGDTTPSFTGTAESGATVTLYDGATVIGSAVAIGGNWSITSSALGQGSHSITARAFDAAGNQGAASSALTVQVETGAPATTIASVNLSADTGASGADFVTRTAAQTISGTLNAVLAANERVEVSLDNGGSWSVASAAVGSASWSLAATLAAGASTLLARVVNAVDNAGPVFQQDITLDTAAPSVTIASNVAQLKAGESATITFSFSDDPGNTFTWDGSAGDAAVSGGSLSALSGSGLSRTAVFTPSASTNGGAASISVGAGAFADVAGNLNTAGGTPTLSFDTLAPNAPSIPALDTDSGASSSDRITKDDTPTFSGTAEAGATITLFGTDGSVIGSGTAGALDGAWSITTSVLGEGAHTVTAQARDAAGNTGAASAAQAVTIDKTAPSLAITSSTPQLKVGETATITFSFSEDPGLGFSNAAVTVSGGTLGALSGAGLTRTAVFTPAAGLDGGVAGISVAAGAYRDIAGNDGGAGAAPGLRFDTLAPAAPSAPLLAAASDTGTVGDGVTRNSSPLIEGTAAANAAVVLYEGASVVGNATADASGKWSIGAALAVGSHTLTASQVDAAGNASPRSAAFVLQIEAPPAPPPRPDPLVDGVPVQNNPVSLPGGVVGRAVQVPVVTSGRVETDGRADVADISLAASGAATLLLAQLPAGFGLGASGANVGGASAAEVLIASIKAATPGHAAADQGHLTGNGQAFLAGLAGDSLLVQTVKPVSVNVPAGPLALQGPSAAPGQQVALVIDTGAMAGGGAIELQQIDFAAVIGRAEIVARGGDTVLAGDGANQGFIVDAGPASAVFAGGGSDTLGFGLLTVQPPSAPAAQPSVTILHGGQAVDTAVFLGARGDYDIERHNGYLVVSSKAAPHAKALVVNVEKLQFSNGSVAVDNADGLDTLAGMYQSVLGRQADLFGFEYWADAREDGASWGAIGLRMIASSERGVRFDGDAAHDLALLYQALFNRAADSAGLAYWQDVMQQGVSLEQVATSMVESVEMVGHRRAVTDWDFSV